MQLRPPPHAALRRRCVGLATSGLAAVCLLAGYRLWCDVAVQDGEASTSHLDLHLKDRFLESGEHDLKDLLERAHDFVHEELGRTDQYRHASAYLHYSFPEDLSGQHVRKWFQRVVPTRSADDTYFAVEGTNTGYFGLQQVRDFPYFEGRVMFSQWDVEESSRQQHSQCKAELVECGPHAVCTTFGGEGTGVKSYINFNSWKLEEGYGFVTTAEPTDHPLKAIRAGYFHAQELGGWVLLSKVKVCTADGAWALRQPYSFTEQWTKRDADEDRYQKLGPSYAEYQEGRGEWAPVTSAKFSHTASAGENQKWVTAHLEDHGKFWGLGIGQDLERPSPQGLTVRAQPEPPSLRDFVKLEQAGKLPTGCAGATCTKREFIRRAREAISASHLALTLCVIVGVVLVGVGVSYLVADGRGAGFNVSNNSNNIYASGPSEAALQQHYAQQAFMHESEATAPTWRCCSKPC